MYISSWQQHACPKCKTHNMINFGNTSDYTGIDPSHCECYSCNCIFGLDYFEDGEEYTKDISKGRKVPERAQ